MVRKWSAAFIFLILAVGTAGAEEEKAEKPRRVPTPLKLQIVFTRYQGEKKVSSVPYVLSLGADDRSAKLRMGIQVPIRVQGSQGQVSYKDVGNNLDCGAESLADGRFKVACSCEQSSVYTAQHENRATGSAVGDVPLEDVPLFRVFRSDANLVLRDGQSAQYTSATDPVSGEVLKIDVTLSVLK